MLDYTLLAQKPTISAVKDNKLVRYTDLLTKTYNGNIIDGGRIVVVEDYYVARPDLISLAIYGDDKYGDIICKMNGLSNPFELNKGMIIYVPDSSVISRIFTGSQMSADILDEFMTVKSNNEFHISASEYTHSTTDEETIERKSNNLQKYKNERRSPGEQTVTDTNYTLDKSLGLIIY